MLEALKTIYEANKLGIWLWVHDKKVKFKLSDENSDASGIMERLREYKDDILKILEYNEVFDDHPVLPFIYRTWEDQSVLSFAQERLWFIEEFEQGTSVYHIPIGFELDETTDADGVKFALRQIVSRHEILRTTIQNKEQHVVQVIHHEPLPIADVQLTGDDNLEELLKEDVNRPFDLGQEYPIRVKFYRAATGSKGRTVLLVNTHHIASDGWSNEIFKKELDAYYQAYLKKNSSFSLSAPDIQYKDYALWQRFFLSGEILDRQLDYWKNKLSGYQTLNLSTDYARPGRADYRGSQVLFRISKRVSDSIRDLSKQLGATPHSVLLSCFNILLSKYTCQNDIVVGSPIANRHHRQTQGLIGFFVNMEINRTLLKPSQTFEDLICEVHQQQISAHLHQDLPFEKLVNELGVERDLSRHPIFQVAFVTQSFGGSNRIGEKQKEFLKPFGGSLSYEREKFDLSVFIDNSGEEMSGQVTYATSLFHQDTISRLAKHYTFLLDQLTKNPKKFYSQVSLLSKDEYEKIVHEWNSTDHDYSAFQTIHRCFEAQVSRTPDRIALEYEGMELSYGELNEKSNQVARHIREEYRHRTGQSMKADTLVAVYMERSLEMVIGILGILKSGGCYVPMDVGHPQDRIDYLLEDTQCPLIVSQRHLSKGSVYLPQSRVLYIDIDQEDIYGSTDKSNLSDHSGPSDLAYVIYTSGTTGRPKGVMIEHRGIVNRLEWMQRMYGLTERDVVLQKTPYVFDVSVWELLWAHWYGARLVMCKPEGHKDNQYLQDLMERKKVTVLHFVPSMLGAYTHYLEDHHLKFPSSVRQVICSGEALPGKVVDQSYENSSHDFFRVDNLYGPTEASIDVTFFKTRAGDKVPIGKPIQNTRVYILDGNLVPVPIGVVGELYLGGAGVARGYLNNKELTQQRFVANVFASESDRSKGYTRLYKTGDLVRWLEDGNIEYIGRNDEQVKIRGYRIEPAEVEHAMNQVGGIRQSCVVVKERDTQGGVSKYLVGYYVKDADVPVSESMILEILSRSLPEYMVPAVLVGLDSFPVTGNGKLDRSSLPDADFTGGHDQTSARTGPQAMLCRLWEEVLGLDQVGIHDDFFRIGGDSILSIQLSSRLRKAGYRCQVRDIFECKTIARLLLQIGENSSDDVSVKAEQGLLRGLFGLLPVQQWFVGRVMSGEFQAAHHWNQSFLVKVGKLDIVKLGEAVERLYSHHDILRVRYHRAGGGWRQEYQESLSSVSPLKTLDVKGMGDERIHQVLTDWQSGFDLDGGRLFQAGYLYGYDDGSSRLYFALHHMIVDSVSWRILVEDVRRFYEGDPPGLKSLSYRQWVEFIEGYPASHRQEGLYWKSQLEGVRRYEEFKFKEESFCRVSLSKDQTGRLLHEASKAYHTQINDLLLTAVAYSLGDLNGDEVQGITLEGHGREDLGFGVDPSHTVGWFTSLFPVKLRVGGSLGESIQQIKETLGSIPSRGVGFGSFATQGGFDYSLSDLVGVSFNYLGQFGMEEGVSGGSGGVGWQIVPWEGSGVGMSSSNPDHNVIQITGLVSEGELAFGVTTRLGGDITDRLGRSLERHLVELIDHCVEKYEQEGVSYTPSDFKDVRISQTVLDDLHSWSRSNGNQVSHIYAANSLQQGFIYHALSQADDDAYRVQVLYDYPYGLDEELYLEAWRVCIEQYPSLRTGFNWQEDLIQVVYKKGTLEYFIHDLCMLADQGSKDLAISAIQQSDRQRGFDLRRPTLLRIHLIKQRSDYYTVLKTEHHSISDGWSGSVLLSAVNGYYETLRCGGKVSVREDVSYLLAQQYIGKHRASQLSYWAKVVGGIEGATDISGLLSDPVDLVGYKQVRDPAMRVLTIEGSLYKALKSFSHREGITVNVLVQFVWHKLLQVYSGSSQSIVGTTVSGRDLPIDGIEDSVGLYINTLPLVVDWDNDWTILKQLRTIQDGITMLNTHSFVELARLQKDGLRLFHSLFVFENYPLGEGMGKDGGVRIRDFIEKSDYPLTLLSYEHNERLTVMLRYDGQYLVEEKASLHMKKIDLLLREVVSDAERRHNQISLLTEDEYNRMVYEWNSTEKDYDRSLTLVDLLEDQVARTPDALAVVYEDRQLTYRELNERSNQLARQIRDRYETGAGSSLSGDRLVALYVDRGVEMVIGIIAVLKAGGAYVPMDPSYPQERIDYLLDDTQAWLILSQRHLSKGSVDLPLSRVLYIDLSEALYDNRSNTANLDRYARADDLAYVIYTSGTTGRPKGVMVQHSNVVNFLGGMNDVLPLTSDDHIFSITSISFDISVLELLWCLSRGVLITLRGPNTEMGNLTDPSGHRPATALQITPSYLETLMNTAPQFLQSLKYTIVGGENFSRDLFHKLTTLTDSAIYNMYGPTETTIWSTSKKLTAGQRITIGKPIANTKLYVLNDAGNVCPPGVVGELYIGGAGLARGYWNKPDVTKSRFVENRFATAADKVKGYTRLYKTGDLVRWGSEGEIEFIGRNDDQVKLRGYRIELQEISSTLRRIAGVQKALTVIQDNEIVAYLIFDKANLSIDVQSGITPVRDYINGLVVEYLPLYMIPNHYIVLDEFPLNVNGKIDYRKLPKAKALHDEYVAPTTELEKSLCEIWQQVLGVEKVGVIDSFFRIGGNSITAIRVSHQMGKLLGYTISVSEIFKYPYVRDLAKRFQATSSDIDMVEWTV